MNDLSWLLYFAGISNNLGSTLGFFAFLLGLFSLVMVILSGVASTDKDTPKGVKRWLMINKIWAIPAFVICLTGSVAIPDKKTIYAIAASEVAESALETPTAKKAVAALERFLDNVAPPKQESTSNEE